MKNTGFSHAQLSADALPRRLRAWSVATAWSAINAITPPAAWSQAIKMPAVSDARMQALDTYSQMLKSPDTPPKIKALAAYFKASLEVRPNIAKPNKRGWPDNVDVLAATSQKALSSNYFPHDWMARIIRNPNLNQTAADMRKGYSLCLLHELLPEQPVICHKTYAQTTDEQFTTQWDKKPPALNKWINSRMADQRMFLPVLGAESKPDLHTFRQYQLAQMRGVMHQQFDVPLKNLMPAPQSPEQVEASIKAIGEQFKNAPSTSRKGLFLAYNAHGFPPEISQKTLPEGGANHRWLLRKSTPNADPAKNAFTALTEQQLKTWISKYIPATVPVTILDGSCHSGAMSN